MTAIVGVMNKHAIALAADSAVTYTSSNRSNLKVLNCANKIFNISKYEPVGVMVYSNAALMGTPWDLIIKLYRKELREKKFGTLHEYVNSFFQFLKDKSFFTNEEGQRARLSLSIKDFYEEIRKEGKNKYTQKSSGKIPSEVELTDEIVNILKDFESRLYKSERCPEFKDYKYDDFKLYASDCMHELKEYYKNEKSVDISDEVIDLLGKAYYAIVSGKHKVPGHTGLVFCGYGDDEIFPRLIPTIVGSAFDDRLEWYIDEERKQEISDYNRAAISPFAQVDVMMNILTGISPKIRKRMELSFHDLLSQYNDIIVKTLSSNGVNHEIVEAVKNAPLDNLKKQFMKEINGFINIHYVDKLMDTVEYLDIEDLSNMAESLVALTGLKKRMTSVEETVGGPVDVAVISKIDGFIWKKRKHYFDKNLNSQFFERYNR